MTDEKYKKYIESKGRLELEQILLKLDSEKYPARLEILKARLSLLPELKDEDYNTNIENFIQKTRLYQFHELYVIVISVICVFQAFDINGFITYGQIGNIFCIFIAALVPFCFRKRQIIYVLLFIWWIPQLFTYFKEEEINGVITKLTYYNATMFFKLGFEFGNKPYYVGINFLPIVGFIILKASRKYYIVYKSMHD